MQPVAATASSTYYWSSTYDIRNAFDRDLGRRNFLGGGCFHSGDKGPHTMDFDLGGEYVVTGVSILNRTPNYGYNYSSISKE